MGGGHVATLAGRSALPSCRSDGYYSNALNNRDLSEKAIMDRQCDNMRCAAGSVARGVRVTLGHSI